MAHYEYQLEKARLRPVIDLQEFTDEIRLAVNDIFPDLSNFRVHSDYFEFDLPLEASHGQKVNMGKKISQSCIELNALVTKHLYNYKDGSPGVSTRLFKRRN